MILSNLKSLNKRKSALTIYLPAALVLAILGFGFPVYFSSVSENALRDVGDGSKSIEEEIVRQFRQNNLGPAEMLLPLASITKREEFSEVIRSKKQEHPELAISGGGSIFDMLTFSEYFGGLDRYNLDRGRFEAFFVYNRATTRGDLRERLQENSSNDNVLAVLNAIPREGRPGNFWARLLSEPRISAFPGVKVAKLEGFPFFPERSVLLSVGIKSPNEFDKNASEAEIRDSCLEEARSNLARFSSKAEWFKVTKSGSDAVVAQWDGNHSLPVMDFENISLRSGMLKIGRSQDGGYLAIVGGIINKMGEVERHGRWLPHPILVPMMVGTAMSLEKEYYSADATFEIGRLSQKALSGDLPAKERIRSFYWAAHQLARKMNLMQMAELTQSCPDLQGVFDLAALIRMRNRPLSESIGRIKSAERELGFLPLGERESAVKKLKFLIDEKKVAQNDFERELQVIYAGTLLSGDPDGIYRFVKSYPVYVKDGDEDAAVAALRDLKIAMSYGQGSVQHLLKLNKPIHDEGPFESLVAPVFPLLGGDLLTHLSHSHRDFALFLKNFLIISSFFFVILFFAKILPKPTYQRSESHFFLRWSRRVSGAALLGLLSILFLEPTLLQSPRGQVSVAGFDFALANLLAYANEESMAEQNLTIVTAIIAGVFLLIQIVIFMVCYSRVSQIKNEELKAGLKLGLLDNEENLFDLGLYIGLGGTVLSLILLLVLDVKQDALIGAYTSTLFGILFVAALKITIVRPYRNHLLVKQAGEKRYES
ncbi:MAG: hypothetical protein CBC00_04350 [Verrucomicrobia bacterium TMED40]|nr:MAG: hypothetical protein CBC00_04350 [Verrucomicrobia bacterium TMED40]